MASSAKITTVTGRWCIPVHVVVDSTGLKAYGEGEWKVRRHGAGRRRTWRKVHLAFDADVKNVIGVEVTTEEWADGEVFKGLLDQMGPRASGRGGCLRHPRRVRRGHGARVAVPPRDNAVPWEADHPCIQALAAIAEHELPA